MLEKLKQLIDLETSLEDIAKELGRKPKECLDAILSLSPEVEPRYRPQYLSFRSKQRKKSAAKYRENNRDKARKYYREVVKSRLNTPEAREKARIKALERRKSNPEHARRVHREWYARNKNKILPRKLARSRTPEARAKARAYDRRKWATDPNYKVMHALRSRLLKVLNGTKKYKTTLELLGCSREFLISYLESKFTEGMRWDNYGFGKEKWSLDHIIPLSHFDLSDPDQLSVAAHYSNLQPMWCTDNFKKGNRYVG
jgi:hypothetical protein